MPRYFDDFALLRKLLKLIHGYDHRTQKKIIDEIHWRLLIGEDDFERLQKIWESKTRMKKVVFKALENLDIRVNKSTGILHPQDRYFAVKLFHRLRHRLITWNPKDVKSRLIRHHHWREEFAEDVEDVCSKMLSGIDVKTIKSGGAWSEKTVASWLDSGLS